MESHGRCCGKQGLTSHSLELYSLQNNSQLVDKMTAMCPWLIVYSYINAPPRYQEPLLIGAPGTHSRMIWGNLAGCKAQYLRAYKIYFNLL